MTAPGKSLPLVSRSLALIFKQKHNDATRRGNAPAPEEFVPREIFEEFREMNCVSLWNINMEEAVRNICYVGHLVPFTILIDGDERHLQTLKVGWIKRLVRSPTGFKLEAVGDIAGAIEVSCVPQTQFIPLDEALCFIVHDLNCSGSAATLSAIRERLRSWYRDLQMPDDDLLINVLHGLVRDVKLYQTANGFCIMTPDKAHVANWLAAQHGRGSAPATGAAVNPVADNQAVTRMVQPNVTQRFWNGEVQIQNDYAYTKAQAYPAKNSKNRDSEGDADGNDGDNGTQAQPLYCTHEFATTDAIEPPMVGCADTFGLMRNQSNGSNYSIASQFKRLNVRDASEKQSKSSREQNKAPKTSSKKPSSVSVLKKLLPDRESKRSDDQDKDAPMYLYQTQPLDVTGRSHPSTNSRQNNVTQPVVYSHAPSTAAYQFAQAQAQAALQQAAASSSGRPSRHASAVTINGDGNANSWNYQQQLQVQHPAAHVLQSSNGNGNCAASNHSHSQSQSSAANSVGDLSASASASASASNHSASNRVRMPPNAAATASSSPACGRRKTTMTPIGGTKRDPLACSEMHKHSQPMPAASACACAACVDVHAQLETFRAGGSNQPAQIQNQTQTQTPVVADSGFASSHHTESKSNGSANETNGKCKTGSLNNGAMYAYAIADGPGPAMVDRMRCSPRLMGIGAYGSYQAPGAAERIAPNAAMIGSQHREEANAGDGASKDPEEYRVMGVV